VTLGRWLKVRVVLSPRWISRFEGVVTTPFVALHERAKPDVDQIEGPGWKRENAERYRLFETPKKSVGGQRDADRVTERPQ
jgi:hypothetical protein